MPRAVRALALALSYLGLLLAVAAAPAEVGVFQPPRPEGAVAEAARRPRTNRSSWREEEEAPLDRRLGDGGITVSWFGEDTVKYFVGAEIVSGGRGLILTAEPFMKVTLMNSPKRTSQTPADFAYLQLAGNSFRVTVNMGSPGASCGCNVAFFLVSMPSTGPGQFGDFYCDANCVGGNCCPEFDLIEMNTHALQVTNHKCSNYQKPPKQYGNWECDHGGSPIVKFANSGSEFGPGDHFTINSQQPFEFRMDFPFEGGVLKGHVVLTQRGRTVRHTMHNLDSIRGPLTDGMALVLDAWEATDMTWLDGGSCGNPSSCNKQSTIFENLVLTALGGGPPSPAGPSPASTPAPSTAGPGPSPPQCDCDWANSGTCVHDDSSACFRVCCCSCDWANVGTCQHDDGSACFHACCYSHNKASFDLLFASGCGSFLPCSRLALLWWTWSLATIWTIRAV